MFIGLQYISRACKKNCRNKLWGRAAIPLGLGNATHKAIAVSLHNRYRYRTGYTDLCNLLVPDFIFLYSDRQTFILYMLLLLFFFEAFVYLIFYMIIS